MTIQLYLKDTYLFHYKATLLKVGQDDKGHFIVLDQTIFYPQGGGQPSDQGIIQHDRVKLEITSVRQVADEIRHYTSLFCDESLVNALVDCFVNQERRLLNSRYHTAAHLLGNIVEIAYPQLKAVKGHSFPGEAYVEFEGEHIVDPLKIQTVMNEELSSDHKISIFEIAPLSFEERFYKLPYSIPENKKFRVMQIGTLSPVPCGGTHVASTKEIGDIMIRKIKVKNSVIRISYEVT
jgi:alanyl-tRNA synthetase